MFIHHEFGKKKKNFWNVVLKSFQFGSNLNGFYKQIIKSKMDACNKKNTFGLFFLKMQT